MMNTKRIVYLDMAKGIGMLLVVVGHVEYINPALRQFIAAFHMPLFFLISGILIWERHEEERNFIEIVKRKVRSMMLPYVIFSLLSFGIESARIAIKGLDEWDVVFRQLFQSCCLQGVSTLWFLPALFISELVFIGLRKRTSNKFTIGITSGIVILCAWFNAMEQGIYQMHADSLRWEMLHDVLSMLLRNLFCVGFIAAGYYFGKVFNQKVKSSTQELWMTVVGGMFSCIVIILNGSVDLRYMQLQYVPFYLMGAVLGGLTVIMLCRLLLRSSFEPLKKMFVYYGRNSLIIMVTHMDFRVLYLSIKAAVFVTGGSSQVLFCVLIVLFVFLFEIPIIWFLKHFLPFLLGKKYKVHNAFMF